MVTQTITNMMQRKLNADLQRDVIHPGIFDGVLKYHRAAKYGALHCGRRCRHRFHKVSTFEERQQRRAEALDRTRQPMDFLNGWEIPEIAIQQAPVITVTVAAQPEPQVDAELDGYLARYADSFEEDEPMPDSDPEGIEWEPTQPMDLPSEPNYKEDLTICGDVESNPGPDAKDMSGITCHNCGKPGHKKADCKVPKDPKRNKGKGDRRKNGDKAVAASIANSVADLQGAVDAMVAKNVDDFVDAIADAQADNAVYGPSLPTKEEKEEMEKKEEEENKIRLKIQSDTKALKSLDGFEFYVNADWRQKFYFLGGSVAIGCFLYLLFINLLSGMIPVFWIMSPFTSMVAAAIISRVSARVSELLSDLEDVICISYKPNEDGSGFTPQGGFLHTAQLYGIIEAVDAVEKQATRAFDKGTSIYSMLIGSLTRDLGGFEALTPTTFAKRIGSRHYKVISHCTLEDFALLHDDRHQSHKHVDVKSAPLTCKVEITDYSTLLRLFAPKKYVMDVPMRLVAELLSPEIVSLRYDAATVRDRMLSRCEKSTDVNIPYYEVFAVRAVRNLALDMAYALYHRNVQETYEMNSTIVSMDFLRSAMM